MEIGLWEIIYVGIFFIALSCIITLAQTIYYRIKRTVISKGSIILITGCNGGLSRHMLEYLAKTAESPCHFILLDKDPISQYLTEILESASHTIRTNSHTCCTN